MNLPKIGRNEPCPCGSGQKYKKCCLPRHSQIRAVASTKVLHPHRFSFTEYGIREDLDRRQRRQFGEIRPFIHVNAGDRKVVVVGDEIHLSKEWRFFPDFLRYYLKRTILTPEWLKAESERGPGKRHPLFDWYIAMCDHQRMQQPTEDGTYACVPSGPMKAYLAVANDLYTLRHHSSLQERLLKRLRDGTSFQGARHELFATATCIRAGFEIEFEDESDPSSKHPEFTATHRATGEVIAVEAKSRHRRGIQAFPGEPRPHEELRPDIGPLLTVAFRKCDAFPYVVFVDLNLPPDRVHIEEERFQVQMLSRVTRAARNVLSEADPYNLVIFTNHPYHFGDPSVPTPDKVVFGIRAENPRGPTRDPRCIDAILHAAAQCDNIPNAFPA